MGYGKTNIIGLDKAQRDLRNLQYDTKVDGGNVTKAERGLYSILTQIKDAWQQEYSKASSAGVEHTDHVMFKMGIYDRWGRVEASNPGLFFAEFGSGINLNKGTERGVMLGYTPTSWSTGASGKGFLAGGKLVFFNGWWPVKNDEIPGAQKKDFIYKDKIISRTVVQGNAPVNATAVAAQVMRDTAAKTMKHFFESK